MKGEGGLGVGLAKGEGEGGPGLGLGFKELSLEERSVEELMGSRVGQCRRVVYSRHLDGQEGRACEEGEEACDRCQDHGMDSRRPRTGRRWRG